MQPTTNKLVKRFVAPSMRRALDLVRDELGPEAVILSSQKTAEGVEVITSLEPDLPTRGIGVRREFGGHFDTDVDTAMNSDSAWQMQAGVDEAAAQFGGRVEMNDPKAGIPVKGEELAREIERARERMMDAKRHAKESERPIGESLAAQEQKVHAFKQHQEQANTEPASRLSAAGSAPAQASSTQASSERVAPVHRENDVRMENLQGEIADMRMILEQQLWKMAQQDNPIGVPSQIKLPMQANVLSEHMARLGLPETISQRLMREAGSQKQVSKAWRACMSQLANEIPVFNGDLVNSGGIFAFVGQTGVGKTTTIAKLAARYVLEHGPGKVALVTTDTYRVGAFDQLRSLGRILNVPVRAVDGQNSLVTLLTTLREFPLILIDTAGFRHGDPLLKDQLRKLDSCPSIKRVLVMACNSQLQTMKASTHAYASSGGIDACVLSKLDESASLGEVISVVLEQRIPIVYTTDGQEIPKDITIANGHKLVAAAVALLKIATAVPAAG
ncbi:flagellar biosynthesis protein FlhF [Teredinibacter franksiae]|uniref:flagellar biosynthesis protein FlhF n=1 Tax=Teredinibacter franksiae TaxID=2761453 RepID=UPI001623F9EC|nr:flagellar biosynthesis protein FlhF [Teredinibacter franksiae]